MWGNNSRRHMIPRILSTQNAGTLNVLLRFVVMGLLGAVFLHLLPEASANEALFQGITLAGPNATEVWDPEHKNDGADGNNQHFGADQKLIIKMALLGPEAKKGELNVLQVEAMGLKGPIKTPIALLEMGKTAQIILDLSFPDPPVTFTLVAGSGPVHIVGHNLLGTHMEEFDDMDDEMEEENIDDEDDEKEPEDEEDEDEEPKKKNAKLSAAAKNKTQANKNKKK